MDSGAANLLLGGRGGVRAMTPDARERYLLGWGTSRLPQRRTAFQALRKLLSFLAYGGGEGAPQARLEAIGYRPDDPPATPDPLLVQPLKPPAAQGDARWVLDADAVVVGSGAGGGVIAAELAAAGRSVVVLEAGPFVDEAAMPRAEVDAFDRLYLDLGLLTTWDGSITMLAGAAVGGGTLVNWMTSIGAPASVREEWASKHGLEGVIGSAWDDDVLAIETELGVAESTHIPPKDAVILRGARELGWEAAPTRRNATSCGDCGSCPFGCRRGTKRSGIRGHLARAASCGARVVAGARVTRVLIADRRAAGVEADVAVQGGPRRLTVRAPVVVVAAGALRTPAVLLRSGLDHPGIGRNLRLHPVPVVAGRFDEDIEMWRGTMQAARSLEFIEQDGKRNGYAIESAPGHPGLLALALPWEGREAHARVMSDATHISPLIAVTRDGGAGRVSVTRAGRVRVGYALDARGVATLRHGLVSMARLARAAGAQEIVAVGTPPAWYRADEPGAGFDRFIERLSTFDCSPNRAGVFSAHQMGSVRMGSAPADHPCDPSGRVRSGPKQDAVVRGLWVGDGSLFPTGIGVNPMITIMAMARRVSRTILAEA
jgi:choline dehydrogenase-like flavoprotein